MQGRALHSSPHNKRSAPSNVSLKTSIPKRTSQSSRSLSWDRCYLALQDSACDFRCPRASMKTSGSVYSSISQDRVGRASEVWRRGGWGRLGGSGKTRGRYKTKDYAGGHHGEREQERIPYEPRQRYKAEWHEWRDV